MGVLTDWLIVDPDIEGRAAAKAHGGPVEFHPVDGTVLALYPHHPRFYITCGWCGVWPMNGLLTRRRAATLGLPELVWGDDTMCRPLAVTLGRGSILIGGSMGAGKSTVVNAVLAAANRAALLEEFPDLEPDPERENADR